MKQAHELLVNTGLWAFLGGSWFVNWFTPETLKSDILFIGGVFLIVLQCIHQIVKIIKEK